MFFSKSTTEARKQHIKEALGIPKIRNCIWVFHPLLAEKKASFKFINGRVWKKLNGWEEKLLSQARREILIKTIVQAIRTYTMSCFKLPLGLCNKIESLV